MKIYRKYKLFEFLKATILALTGIAAFHPDLYQNQIAWTVFATAILLSAVAASHANLERVRAMPFHFYGIYYAGIIAAFYTVEKWDIPALAACLLIIFMTFLALSCAGNEKSSGRCS